MYDTPSSSLLLGILAFSIVLEQSFSTDSRETTAMSPQCIAPAVSRLETFHRTVETDHI